MITFFVSTENFIARKIACKALKNIDNDIAHDLYKKASMHGNKIIITTVAEIHEWVNALSNYVPIDAVEKKVWRALIMRAKIGYTKRTKPVLSI